MRTDAELRLLDHAERNHGIFTRRIAREAGVPDARIDQRIRTGRWELVQPRTVRVVGAPPTFHSDVLAAVLAAADGGRGGRRRAVASHGTAARLLGLGHRMADLERDPVEITVAGRGGMPQLWWDTVVHRTGSLPSQDVTEVDGVPCTSGPRLVVDLAPAGEIVDALALADDVIGARLGTAMTVHACASRLATGRRHVWAVRDATGPGGADRFRSWLERTMSAELAVRGLTGGEWNAPIGTVTGVVAEADILFRTAKVIVELDGLRFHSTPAQLARDRVRDRTLALMGYVVLRFSYREVVQEPDAVVAEIRHALALRTTSISTGA
jgi:hypothetical protein